MRFVNEFITINENWYPVFMHKAVLSLLLVMFVVSGCATDSGMAGDSVGRSNCSTIDLTNAYWVSQNSDSIASLRGMSAVSSDVAWASGAEGTVLLTLNGGKTWRHRPIDLPDADTLDYRDIHAFNVNSAIVLSAGAPARMFRTDDGGSSWKQVYANDTEGVFFDAMSFWEESHGLAFSDPVGGTLLIVATDDGGYTWFEIDASSIPKAFEGEAGFAGSGTCLTTMFDPRGNRQAWIGLGGDTKIDGARVFHSADSGHTWNASRSPLDTSASAGIFSIAFGDPRHGVMVGGDYLQPDDKTSNVAYTINGGLTWNRPIKSKRPRGYRSVVCALSGGKMYVAGGTTGTDYTLDGGSTWAALGNEGYNVIAISHDGKAMWAAGEEGRIAILKQFDE